MVVAEVVVAEGDAAAVWSVCPIAQAGSTATSTRVTDWSHIIEIVLPHNFYLEHVLISKKKERFRRLEAEKNIQSDILATEPLCLLTWETPHFYCEVLGQLLARISSGIFEVKCIQLLLEGVG